MTVQQETNAEQLGDMLSGNAPAPEAQPAPQVEEQEQQVGDPGLSRANRTAERRRQITDMLSNNVQVESLSDDMEDAPSFVEGAIISGIDDGMANNLRHLFLDTFQPIATEEDYEEKMANLDVLREGVPEEYWEEIESQVNFQSALRKSDLVRQRLANEHRLAKQGLVTGMASGMAGWVIDPVNYIPGGVIAKTAQGTYRAAQAWNVTNKVLQAATKNKVAKFTLQTSALAGLGMAEEAIRQIPRLHVDPTYNYDDYKFDVVVGSLVGGGLSVGYSGVKYLDAATTDIQGKLFNVENRLQVSKAANIATNLVRESVTSLRNDGITKTVLNNPKDIVGKAVDTANRQVALKRVKMEPHNIMQRISQLEDPTPEEIDTVVRESMRTITQNLTKTVGSENRPEMIRMVDELYAKLDPEAEAREAKAADDTEASKVDPTFKPEPDERSVEQALNDAAKDIERAYKELDTFLQSEEVAKMYNVEGIFCEM